MAPSLTYYRVYCKECNEYMLHSLVNDDNEHRLFECHNCGYTHVLELLKDIPEDKKEAQRKRYAKANIDSVMSIFKPKRIGLFGPEFFDEPGSNPTIIESSAGQKKINQQREEKRIKEEERINELKDEYNLFYKQLGLMIS